MSEKANKLPGKLLSPGFERRLRDAIPLAGKAGTRKRRAAGFTDVRREPLIRVRVDDYAPHGGCYEATVIVGTLRVDGTDGAGGPELDVAGDPGLSEGARVLVVSLSEDGSDDHLLPLGSFWWGVRKGGVPAGGDAPGPYAGWPRVEISPGVWPLGNRVGQVYAMVTDERGAMTLPFFVNPG